MIHPPQAKPTDERLARLLQVERDLEARAKAAEVAARAEIAAAQERARRIELDGHADLEAQARAEETADLQAHAEQLRRIAEEGAARVAHLSAIPAEVVERLAVRAVSALAAREEGRRP
jgi:uncharacterized membrane protein YqiK